MKKQLPFLLFLLFCTLIRCTGQQTHERFTRPVNYLLYLPDGYDKDTAIKWPLVLFLHGSGESGDDLEKVKVHGPAKLVEAGKKFPFILVSPQAARQEDGWLVEDLFYLLQDMKKNRRVDPDRIYLTGLSMGGFGTWALAIRHPEEFAAIIPICGGGDTTNIWKLRNIPVWCFHGAKDSTVPLARDQEMIHALKAFNPSAKLTVYPDLGHNSWTVTYNNDSIYQWLLSKKRFQYRQADIKLSLLKKYEGIYTGAEQDTVFIAMTATGLLAMHKNQQIPLLSASENLFFIDPKIPLDIRFRFDSAGKVTGMIVYENEKSEYRKLPRR